MSLSNQVSDTIRLEALILFGIFSPKTRAARKYPKNEQFSSHSLMSCRLVTALWLASWVPIRAVARLLRTGCAGGSSQAVLSPQEDRNTRGVHSHPERDKNAYSEWDKNDLIFLRKVDGMSKSQVINLLRKTLDQQEAQKS